MTMMTIQTLLGRCPQNTIDVAVECDVTMAETTRPFLFRVTLRTEPVNDQTFDLSFSDGFVLCGASHILAKASLCDHTHHDNDALGGLRMALPPHLMRLFPKDTSPPLVKDVLNTWGRSFDADASVAASRRALSNDYYTRRRSETDRRSRIDDLPDDVRHGQWVWIGDARDLTTSPRPYIVCRATSFVVSVHDQQQHTRVLRRFDGAYTLMDAVTLRPAMRRRKRGDEEGGEVDADAWCWLDPDNSTRLQSLTVKVDRNTLESLVDEAYWWPRGTASRLKADELGRRAFWKLAASAPWLVGLFRESEFEAAFASAFEETVEYEEGVDGEPAFLCLPPRRFTLVSRRDASRRFSTLYDAAVFALFEAFTE